MDRSTFYALKQTAAMQLRPNPTMYFHRLIAKRSCLHLDVFARRAPASPTVAIVIEQRMGGVDPAFMVDALAMEIGDYDREPWAIAPAALELFTDALNFANLSAADYRWARDMHHDHLLPIVNALRHEHRPELRCRHTSVLFHYFPALDLPPFPASFVNHYRQTGKGSRLDTRPEGTAGKPGFIPRRR